jgi:hypothetical protein
LIGQVFVWGSIPKLAQNGASFFAAKQVLSESQFSDPSASGSFHVLFDVGRNIVNAGRIGSVFIQMEVVVTHN